LARGTATFFGNDLYVAEGVLVPRSASEVLVTAAMELFDVRRPLVAIDIGTGCGNVALALAIATPLARVYATDVAPIAVKLTERNVCKLGLGARVTTHLGDLFGPLEGLDLGGTIDLVTSSPPFISSGRLERDRAPLLRDEPRVAFDAGPYGITIHQRLFREALPFLTPGRGWLIAEFGAGQASQVEHLIVRSRGYDEIRFFEGPSGIINAVGARRR
jgi:HemK-like putative methylase